MVEPRPLNFLTDEEAQFVQNCKIVWANLFVPSLFWDVISQLKKVQYQQAEEYNKVRHT